MACEQTAYVEGIIAANMTQSGKVGAIGPIQGDSLVKIINGFEDGALSVNPDLVVETAWTNSFVDTPLAKEAATAMIEDGVDVIKHCANALRQRRHQRRGGRRHLVPGRLLRPELAGSRTTFWIRAATTWTWCWISLGLHREGTFVGGVYNLGMADNAVAVLLSDNLPPTWPPSRRRPSTRSFRRAGRRAGLRGSQLSTRTVLIGPRAVRPFLYSFDRLGLRIKHGM
jgi:basic membrane protein A